MAPMDSAKPTLGPAGRLTVAGLLALLAASAASAKEPEAVPVAISTVARAQVYEEIPLTATVTAPRAAELSPRMEGLVAELLVDEGDAVQEGEVLARLDDALARIALQRAEAALAEARARLAEAQRRRREAEDLVRKNHMPATSLAERTAAVRIQSAALERLRAERARIEEEIARHELPAPFAGVVARKLTDLGEWVDTGTAVIELVETVRLRVEVPVPQVFYSRIGAGTPVALRFDAQAEPARETRITRIVPVTNPAARTFTAHIDLDNSDGRLAPGMSARVTLKIGKTEGPGELMVPRDAIVAKPDGSTTVWVLREVDGRPTAEPVPVTTGRAMRGRVEVTSGDLEAGDEVIVRGNERLQAGQPVLVKDAAGAG